jgi:hypothetical protein
VFNSAFVVLTIFRLRILAEINRATRGGFFVHFFRGKFQGKFRGKFSPQNVGKQWNFPRKKFQEIIFPRNSTEFSAERDFPQKKNVRKIGPDGFVKKLYGDKNKNKNKILQNVPR